MTQAPAGLSLRVAAPKGLTGRAVAPKGLTGRAAAPKGLTWPKWPRRGLPIRVLPRFAGFFKATGSARGCLLVGNRSCQPESRIAKRRMSQVP